MYAIEDFGPVDSRDSAAGAKVLGRPRISVRNLRKQFQRLGGSVVVPVQDVSFEIASNEMLVLLGPSGCGKTTLLRCIAGLERPDLGSIRIDDMTVFDSVERRYVQPNQRPISMVFQSYALWPHMTMFDNVAYPLRCKRVAGEELRRRVTETLALVGLSGLEAQYPARLSGGQQQRVALARAVVSGSGVVLFDEPLSNVDAQVREQLRMELQRMQRALHFSALYVTHDQTEAMAIGDRIAVIREGRIEQLGTPEEIYSQPASEYVGTFVGHPNVLKGRADITARGDGIVEAQSLTFRRSAGRGAATLGRPIQGEVTVLIRPEKVSLSKVAPKDPDIVAFECDVETRSFLGMHTEHSIRVGDIAMRVVVPGRSAVEAGAKAWASVASGDVLLFGADGKAIQVPA